MDENVDNLSYGMLVNNDIPHVAAIQYLQSDEKRMFRYNISSKVNVTQYFTGLVTKKRFLGVLQSIGKALLSAEDYMIEPSTFILDLDYIFVDVSTSKADLICLPIEGLLREEVDLSEMFKNLLFNLQFDQSEDSSYVAEVLNLLNSMQIFSLSRFVEKIEELYMESELNRGKKAPINKSLSSPKIETPVASDMGNFQIQSQANNFSQNNQSNAADNFQSQSVPSATHGQAQFRQPTQAPTPLAPSTPAVPGTGNVGGQAVQAGQVNAPMNNPAGVKSAVPGQGVSPAMPVAAGNNAKKEKKSKAKLEEPKVLYDENGEELPYLPPLTIGQQLKRIFVIDPEEEKIRKARKKALKRWKESQENGVAEARVVPGAPKPQGFTVPSDAPAPFQTSFGKKSDGFNAPNSGQSAMGQMPQAPAQMPQANNPAQFMPQQNANNFNQTGMNQGNFNQPGMANDFAEFPVSGDSFGETTVLGGASTAGETTVLGGGPSQAETKVDIQPFLVRSKNNERIMLNKPLFRLGKERNYVDYCISDNSAISRSHATINREGDQWFIEDTNSLNHTYVNGEQIPSNTKIPLSHGNTIILANEDFEFRLY